MFKKFTEEEKEKMPISVAAYKSYIRSLAGDYIFKIKKGRLITERTQFLINPIEKAEFFMECVFILKICYERAMYDKLIERLEEDLKKNEELFNKIQVLLIKYENSFDDPDKYKDEMIELLIKNNEKIMKLFSTIIAAFPKQRKTPDFSKAVGVGIDEVDEVLETAME